MLNPIEDSWEEVQKHDKELRGHRVRLYVVDEEQETPAKQQTVADALAGHIGKFNFGVGTLSKDVKKVFGEVVEEKFRRQGFKF